MTHLSEKRKKERHTHLKYEKKKQYLHSQHSWIYSMATKEPYHEVEKLDTTFWIYFKFKLVIW